MFLVLGLVMLLMSLTRTGRRLTRGHNRLPLPTTLRKGPTGDLIANVLVTCAGIGFSIVGSIVLLKGISSWLSGASCR